MPDSKKTTKIVQVKGLGTISFPSDMDDEHISQQIMSHLKKKKTSPITTEESEHARQLKPAQPLSTAIPKMPEWANKPILSGLTVDAQIERAEKGGHQKDADWLRKQKALQDKAYEKNKEKYPIATGVTTGVGEFADSMTSPANLALIVGSPQSKLLSAFFSIQALKGSYQNAKQAQDAYDKGNNQEAIKYATEAGLGIGLAYGAGKHAVKDLPVPAPVRNFMENEEGSLTYKASDKSQPFFLKSEKILNDKVRGPMPGEDIHKMLLANGVGPEEMKWTGLDDMLKGKGKEKVTPADIQKHIAENDIQIKEVTKGDNSEEEALRNEYYRLGNARQAAYKKAEASGDKADYEESIRLGQQESEAHNRWNEYRDKPRESTKFAGYTLPGGSNYREMLLTMPQDKFMPSFDEWSRANGYGDHEGSRNLYEKIRNGESPDTTGNSNQFRSSHWEEPNVLGHVRFNDRTGPNGEKILHVEELQSDWHQKGRSEGYRLPVSETSKMDSEYRALVHKNADSRANGGTPNPADVARAKELEEHLIRSDKSKMPDAPFKKEWPELLFKRMLRYAAENGYDGISWTPGEEQASRYDLSKQISRIEYKKGMKYNHTDPQKWTINAFDLDGNGVMKQFVTGDELPNIVGKEVAAKIIGDKEDQGELSGLDLKVGGEGMKGFYDKIVPDIANKLGKKWGTKVGETKIPVQGDFEYKYSGPERTMDDVNTLLSVAQGRGNTKISPITGKPMMFVAERVDVENGLQRIKREMKQGKTFSQAMGITGTPELAEWFGGEVKEAANINQKPVPYMPITPEMRKGVKGEQHSLFGSGTAPTLSDVKAKAEKLNPKQIKESVAHSQSNGVKVTDPNGHIHTFPDEQSASRFKMAAGIQ